VPSWGDEPDVQPQSGYEKPPSIPKTKIRRKRGASDAKAPVPGRSGNGHAAPTPAQFGARAPLAGKAIAPEVPPLSLRGQFLAGDAAGQDLAGQGQTRHCRAGRQPPPQPAQPPKILSAVIRPTSTLGTALSVGFSMGWNGPPLLEVANDDMVDIRASQPQPIDYSVIATAEPAEAAVADTQAEPAAPDLHTETSDTISPPCRCPGMPNLWPRRNLRSRALTPEIPASPAAPSGAREALGGAVGRDGTVAAQRRATAGLRLYGQEDATAHARPATMREATELTQLRAENRRLRMQLGDMMQTQRAPARTLDQRMMDQMPG
jgi:hypothetical protein